MPDYGQDEPVCCYMLSFVIKEFGALALTEVFQAR